MSGQTLLSPSNIDTTLIETGQAAGSITPTRMQQLSDSLSGLVVTQQAGTSYTFAMGDFGTMVESTNASPVSFVVPPNSAVAFPVGTIIAWRQIGAGQLTISAGSGVGLRTSSSQTARVQNSQGAIHQRASNDWVISGDIT
jgi:hypothetical protein